ncbi:MAG: TonB-dependent receptor [Mangrovicoccus sp.]|nr:TonB-dependent receptor [Mangrovicoccus sp.]
MKTSYLALCAGCLAMQPALAQDSEPFELDPIIISGGLTPIAAQKYGRAVSVITSEDLERRQIAHAADALRALPGVAVSQSGGAGGFTQVRIRGAEGNHTLVLIDGVDVAGPESGEFDFAGLLAADIERIEVLRGPQSSIYGSNAIGGVISITTKTATEPGISASAGIEGGSDGSIGANVAIRQRTDRARLSFSAARRFSRGFDISADPFGQADSDDKSTINARAEYDVSDALTVGATLRYMDRTSDYDYFNWGAPRKEDLVQDQDLDTKRKELIGSVFADLDTLDGRLTHSFFASMADFDMLNRDDKKNTSDTSSGRQVLRYRGTFALDAATVDEANHTLSALLERKHETFQNNDASLVYDLAQLDKQERTLNGYVLEYRGSFIDAIDLQASLRYDDNDKFEDFTTYAVGASYRLPNDSTRLHASIGTGVQNPTMYEQFGFNPGQFEGNPDLEPEQSFGWDLGVEQRFWGDRAIIDVTYFRDELTDEIISVYDPITFVARPENADGKSKRQGVEFAGSLDLDNGLSFGLDYTYLDAEDPDQAREVRRPKHEMGLRADYRLPNEKTRLGLDLRAVAGLTDIDFTAPSFGSENVDLDDYVIANITAQHDVTDQIQLYARIENLFDTDYEELDGYATQGRILFAGLRAKF